MKISGTSDIIIIFFHDYFHITPLLYLKQTCLYQVHVP